MPFIHSNPTEALTNPYYGPQTVQTAQTYFPYYSNRDDPLGSYANERDRAQAQMEWFLNRFGTQGQGYGDLEGQYGDLTASLYNPIWGGGGGYTPEQFANVVQAGRLAGFYPNQEDYDALQMTPWEYEASMGDPYAGSRRLDPGQLENLANETAGFQRAAYQQGASNITNPLTMMAGRLQEAVDPTRLRMSDAYSQATQGALGGSEGLIRGLYGNPDLLMGGDYAKKGAMTDEEVARASTLAAGDVGARYGAEADTIRQRALAAGMNPLAAEAMVSHNLRTAAGTAADEASRARLAARNAQIASLAQQEQTRLGAQQYQSGLGTSNEQQLAGRRISTLSGNEAMRIASEQGLSDRAADIAKVSGMSMSDAARYLLGQNLQMESNLGQQGIGLGQWNQGMGAQYAQTGEGLGANRAYQATTNRQGTGRQNLSDVYNRNMGVTQTLSGNYQAGYAPWLQQQQEGRQAALGLTGYYGGQGNQAWNRALNAWGQGTDAANRATQGAAEYTLRRQGPLDTIEQISRTAANFAGAGKGWG